LNATASVVSHSRQNLFGLKDDGGNYPTTGWKTFPAGTVKGGASFNLNKSNSFYANAGYLSRAPMLSNVFAGTTLTPYRGVENEGIIAAELGYLFNRSIFKSAVNLYYTVWNNRPVNQTISVAGERYFVGIPGMNALHKGVEVEAEAQVHRMVSLEGVLSVGDWRWTSESSAVVFDELGTAPIDTIQFNAKGIKVGDAAQFQAAFGIRFEPVKGLYIKPRITYFDNYYADFDPESLSAAGEPVQSWKIPSYYTVDLNIGYPFPVWGKYKLGVRLNLLNILNATYISDARNNEYPSTNANDRGFDASSAGVFMGMGFRWNVGVNMNF
jgi:outer membrane receptor for Fe3+-dicitrate